MNREKERPGLIPQKELLQNYLLNPYDLRQMVEFRIVTEARDGSGHLYYFEKDLWKVEAAITIRNEEPDMTWSEVAKELPKEKPESP